jgi:hypothetical protein
MEIYEIGENNVEELCDTLFYDDDLDLLWESFNQKELEEKLIKGTLTNKDIEDISDILITGYGCGAKNKYLFSKEKIDWGNIEKYRFLFFDLIYLFIFVISLFFYFKFKLN